eukprot:PITA_29660
MVDEMASLHKNEASGLVELPAGRKTIGSKWVFKKKTNAEGKVEKDKAQFVAKCYSQVSGIDFGDIFSHVTMVASIRLLLSVVAAFDYEVEQMDLKTSFLHVDLEAKIYMKQPEGFAVKVSWKSKKQSVVALSTTEAEYITTTHAIKEAVWLQRLCSSMGLLKGDIRIDCDIQSAIFLAKNPSYHSNTKHIDVEYHFVRDMIEDKKVLLVKVDTLKNITDALKKYVSSEKFSWCRETMGVAGLDK